MSGWIKLYRVFEKWEWYDSPNCVAVFVDLLIRANHEDGIYRSVKIPKGSLTTSHDKISKRTGLTISQVRTVLDKLSLTGEIAVKTTNKYSMISITNWEKFQASDRQPSAKVATSKKLRNKEIKNSPLSFLFKAEDEIHSWLSTGTEAAQKELLDKHSHHVLAEEVKKAFLWQIEKGPRKAGTFLVTWLSNKKTAAFNPQKKSLEEELGEFFKTYAPTKEVQAEAV